ncbi:MAG: NAD(P)H-dependent oxidoreductase [Streptococcaceae bacterium]|jgi:NAD(P)H-dependent FMN reductase|nr:NAD(P)H-dependent oxidoreductase [Streptococcaceae bacterium]
MNFIAIVGTNASFSYNRKLLWYMKKHFSDQVNIEIQEIADIPLFSEDIKEVPLRVRELARAIEASDGVIFSTPEYDHSITAALKSVIEWLSWGELHPLTNVPVMVVGVSLGNMGTVFAQENLRQILSSPGLDAVVLPGHQFLRGRAAQSFDEENGNLTDARSVGWLEHCFASFRAYTETLKPLRGLGQHRGSSVSSVPVAKKYLDEGEGWVIEDISLLPSHGTDADTGSSKQEEVVDADTGSSKAESSIPALAMPDQAVEVIEGGEEGWWIEAINLLDASTGSSKQDSDTGASQHEDVATGKVALGPSGHAGEKGQPDTSTGASQH